MSVMTDPAGNLAAHRLYSEFCFRPGILGDPSLKRGHMWLFRLSEDSCVSEFLRRHPFAEPKVSRSRVNFHDRMLYQMSWADPQTEDGMDLFIEGQPSQTLEGTMPRIGGLYYQEGDRNLELVAEEKDDTISEGKASRFTISIWNQGSMPLQLSPSASIPSGTTLTPWPLSTLSIDASDEKTVEFKLNWLPGHKLPDFTSFPTVPATFYLKMKKIENPLLASAGFRNQETVSHFSD